MRVAFDLRPALKKNSRRRGIGKYTFELAKALLEVADPRLELILYGCGKEKLDLLTGPYEYRPLFQLPKPSRLSWLPDRFLLPRQLSRDRADVFHANDITSIAFRSGTKTVVTVHDLIPLVFREQMKKSVPWDYALALREAFRRMARADLVVTDSAHSKSDICGHLPVDPERVAVVYLGCDSRFAPREPASARGRIAASFGICEPFLFYVGGTDYRKNLPLLIDAFAEIRRSGYSGVLTMAGETFNWDIDEVRRLRILIADHKLERAVRFPGFVSEDQLIDFYSGCDMFLFPSLYEGFGLPVLEALRCGSVVLTTRVSSIPEVAGDAVAYFDHNDPSSLAREFQELYGNAPRQEQLRSKGMARAAGFSWHEAARKLLTLYESVL
ncbi:MAG: glycosyltransferase family 1 protein [Acidobacteria bacterium]|nr:MAG: glycosyltransferase family 1 protein [Acidobacteriota bacterium]